MDVILLERIEHLGQMGDVVKVRNGYARNYLLPMHKALRATDANKARFEGMRQDLEARNIERRQEAEKLGQEIDGRSFILVRQAGETGQLYGSVSARDVVAAADEEGLKVARAQVRLERPIKTLGLHEVRIALHAEVAVTVTMNIARSLEEAERQARGENVLLAQDDEDEEDVVDAEDLLEDEARRPEDEESADDTEAADAGDGANAADDAPKETDTD